MGFWISQPTEPSFERFWKTSYLAIFCKSVERNFSLFQCLMAVLLIEDGEVPLNIA